MSSAAWRSASSRVGRIHLVAAPIAELRRGVGGLAERAVERRAVLGRVAMIATSSKPRASRACRMAPTRPSIMSDGATTSAPASACDECRSHQQLDASGSSRGCLAVDMPQWPCSVYSQRQTSVMTTSLGTSATMARTACGTGPCGSCAAAPASFAPAARTAARRHAIGPRRLRLAHRFVHRQLDTPGIEPTRRRRTPCPRRRTAGRRTDGGQVRLADERTDARRAAQPPRPVW